MNFSVKTFYLQLIFNSNRLLRRKKMTSKNQQIITSISKPRIFNGKTHKIYAIKFNSFQRKSINTLSYALIGKTLLKSQKENRNFIKNYKKSE